MKNKRYEEAKEIYARYGVDTEQVLKTLSSIPLSVHCWQGDDVIGFDGAGSLSGGIETTGNYPGRARDLDELLADTHEALSLMPGKKRLNLHASYAILGEDKGKVDRDAYSIKYFKPWIDFAKKEKLDGIDFNPTFFAHPKMKDGLSLSSPDEATRRFWVEHGKRSFGNHRRVGQSFREARPHEHLDPGRLQGRPGRPDGPRLRLKKSLDEMLENYDQKWVIPAVESKVFGIGLESYTVGSSEFYMNYAAQKGICCLLDSGHFHPTESIADKIPSLLCFYDKVALHLSRPVRWDSDHVVIFDDEMREICKEIVRNGAIDKMLIGLDYFDASINRISAWVTGERSVEKALLYALLLPNKKLKELQDRGDFTALQYEQEKAKFLPFQDVWMEYLSREGLSDDYEDEVRNYEKTILSKRQ